MSVKAKEIFEQKVTEADGEPMPDMSAGPPRRGPGGPRPGGPRRDIHRMTGGPGGEEGGEDGPGGPKGQFNSKELSQLKDVMILILASMLGSDLDKQIATALMNGQPLDPGQLQHILDEARRADIPESHGPLMQKLFGLIGN